MSRIPLEHALLERDEVVAALARPELAGWELDEDGATSALVRTLRFPTFAAAIAFLAEAAPACDALDHHPTWTNTYDRVEVRLTTHEAGDRVTARDVGLAVALGALHAQRHGA